MARVRLLRALNEAVLTMLAALAAMFCALPLDPVPSTAVLAVVLCLSLSRTQLDRSIRGRLESLVVVPLVGLAAVGVGMLLIHTRWLGAALFVGGIFVSIWLRRFGPATHRVASLITLPFVAILVTPRVSSAGHAVLPAFLLPVVVAVLAVVWVTLFHQIGRWTRMLPPQPARTSSLGTGARAKSNSLRPSASTRMAVQMAVALAASFIVGFTVFPDRWAWVVLTAFIVGSGNRGRLDVAYKAFQRLLGAAAGTAVALVLSVQIGGHDEVTGALILAAVFLGIWLRPIAYAWWALFVTVALALLQGFTRTAPSIILLPRLEEIVVGAVIAVAAGWLVLPVRSTSILRRRIADALAALSSALEAAPPDADAADRAAAEFVGAIALVEQVAPAFRAVRAVTRRSEPASWIDSLHSSVEPGVAMIKAGSAPVASRRAVNRARRSLRNTETLGEALIALQEQLHADACRNRE